MNRLLCSAITALLFASSGFSQSLPPPDIDRWTGNTAQSQPQGFSQGSPLRLTWGFMQLGTPINDNFGGYPNAGNNLQTRLDAIYGAGSQATIWQPLFQSTFDRWSSISGLSYTFEPNDDGNTVTGSSTPLGALGTRADVRIGGKPLNGDSGVLAYNYYPNHGDMIIDTNDNFYENTTSNSLRLRNVVAHEHGHGMGMLHVDPNPTSGAGLGGKSLMEPFINLGFNGPQFHDILVAQRGYGDALEKSNSGQGNDIVIRATPLGTVIPGSPASIGNSPRTNMANNNTVVAFTATDFISIDSATDTDFFSFSVANAGNVTVLLEALGITYDARPQGNTNVFNFNTRNRIDLSLTLFDTNGSTILATANNTGLGGDEQIFFSLLSAGTYFVRINGTQNPDAAALDTQFYGLTISMAAVPEPATMAFIGLIGIGTAAGWCHRRRQLKLQLDSCIK